MANYAWPEAYLPFASLRAALEPKPPEVLARTDMEAPKPRVRRRFTGGVSAYPVQWSLTIDQFRLFQAIYKHGLNQGAAWFDMMVFNGEEYQLCACRFVGGYSPKMTGTTWTVSANLELEDLPVLSPAEVEDRWPGALP